MKSKQLNQLLNALSPENRELILSQSKEMGLPIRTPLQSQEELPRHVYFITSGMASVIVALPEGGTSETGLIGREGLSGALSLLGPCLPSTTIFMQVGGSGYRVPFPVIQDLFAQNVEIRARILEHVQQMTMTTSQIAACNNTHEAEARLARWLLMVQDRTHLSTFHLTQEFLAEMLGTRRSTVAVAASALQRTGHLEYSRGRVVIVNREALQAAACECYGVTYRLLNGLYK